MSLLEKINNIEETVNSIKSVLVGDVDSLSKTYKEYKFFADSRGMRLLEENGLVDEFNEFMDSCEDILFRNKRISIPTPSQKLQAFKDKFSKFF